MISNPTQVIIDSQVAQHGRDLAAASGDVSYTGYGFMPRALSIDFGMGGTQAFPKGMGHGFASLTKVVRQMSYGPNTYYNGGSTLMYVDITAGNNQGAILKSWDADGYTLTWTKTGTPTGAFVFVALAMR